MSHNHSSSGPKDVFLHLFNIVMFYLSVIGFITLYIAYINALFPDVLNYYVSSIDASVRWASSVLCISVPAYLITSWMLVKDIRIDPEKKQLWLRKSLIYLTLFVSAITIVVDLMIFVYNFLNGELSTRFFLKVLVVLVIAGIVFWYYKWNLNREGDNKRIQQILVVSLSIVTVASIIAGFFIVGSPIVQRERRFDEQRVSDLAQIQGELISYWQQKDVVPTELSVLEDSISGFKVPVDPNTKMPYEYRKTGELTFELCATFGQKNRAHSIAPYDVYSQNWEHDAGRVCFDREIDPDLYKNDMVDTKPTIVR